jgi:uncharacterized RDD family membrane protein YckC
MIKKLGIEESKAPELCVSLYKYYGTTMAGLRVITQELDALFFFYKIFLIYSDFTKKFSGFFFVLFLCFSGYWA